MHSAPAEPEDGGPTGCDAATEVPQWAFGPSWCRGSS